jgi:hypothetical protein
VIFQETGTFSKIFVCLVNVLYFYYYFFICFVCVFVVSFSFISFSFISFSFSFKYIGGWVKNMMESDVAGILVKGFYICLAL